MGENKKSSKIGFPNFGKTENQRKSPFPTLGRLKIIENQLSQLWED